MKNKLVAAFVGALAMGIAFAATANPRNRDACPEACEQAYYSCVINQVGTEHECYMDYHRCVYRCPAF
jgi:uncharacterized low-complexity protein